LPGPDYPPPWRMPTACPRKDHRQTAILSRAAALAPVFFLALSWSSLFRQHPKIALQKTVTGGSHSKLPAAHFTVGTVPKQTLTITQTVITIGISRAFFNDASRFCFSLPKMLHNATAAPEKLTWKTDAFTQQV